MDPGGLSKMFKLSSEISTNKGKLSDVTKVKANKKLGKGWTRPYRVTGCPTDVNVVIRCKHFNTDIRVHRDHLKLYYGEVPLVWQDYAQEPDIDKAKDKPGQSDEQHLNDPIQFDDGHSDEDIGDTNLNTWMMENFKLFWGGTVGGSKKKSPVVTQL